MEKSRNYVVFGVLALVVSLVAVSLAYAGFSQTLTINGNATVKAAKWHVYLNNVANASNTGNASFTTAPALVANSTVTAEYVATFRTPGDSVEFTFDTVNDGNWAAALDTVTLGGVTCNGTGKGQVLGNDGSVTTTNFDCATAFLYELTDVTASNAKIADNSDATTDIPAQVAPYTTGNLAAKTGTRTYKLKLTYVNRDNATVMPSEDITVSIGSTTFTYSQSGDFVD